MAELYDSVNMLADASEAPLLRDMLANSGIEGCTAQMLIVACWPDDAILKYKPDGSVDMALSPAPTHYLSSGWMNAQALDLLPENVVPPA